MSNLIITKYNKVIFNQIRLKIIKKKLYPTFSIKKIISNIYFFKIDSFKNINILESLFFFRLISKEKGYISYFKKKYKEYDIILNLSLAKKKANYMLFLWLIFFFPLLKKKNLSLNYNFNSGNNIVFINNIYNIYPFFPNIFFSWIKKISHTILFSSKNRKINLLFASYYNIPLNNKK